MNTKLPGSIGTLVAGIMLEARSKSLKRDDVRALSAFAWPAIDDFMHGYSFPLDEAYVDQSALAASIRGACVAYARPDLAAWIELYLYVAWRSAYLTWPWMIYHYAGDDHGRARLHIACNHIKICKQVQGYGYSSCTAQMGDALRLQTIDKPSVAKPEHQIVLDTLWDQLLADDELPQGDFDHAAVLDDVLGLLKDALKNGTAPALEQGLASLVSSVAARVEHKYRRPEPWRSFRPDDALLLICHALILDLPTSSRGMSR